MKEVVRYSEAFKLRLVEDVGHHGGKQRSLLNRKMSHRLRALSE
jgi:hypothetical protein